jgi:eukaryotic-like serine/threonine-protein kinase
VAIATTDLIPPETQIKGVRAEYRIMSLIGRGGMGAVYRALRLADQTIWALKEMRPPDDITPDELVENRRMFLQEAELLSHLSHPNLPVVADFFEYNNRPVMVMEFVPGQTLEDRVQDANAPLLEQDVIRFGIQTAGVLHYLHTRTPPIIYRDLKPSNIMVTPDSVLKLIDFGVARTYKARKSKDTVAMGSAGYAPPEQYGKGQTDARSDVYALGATLLHLMTALPPIPLQTPTLGSIHKMNPSVDTETEKIIIKSMDLDPASRFLSAAEFEQALRTRLDGPYVDPTAKVLQPSAIPIDSTVLGPRPPQVVTTPPARQPSSASIPTVSPTQAAGTAPTIAGSVAPTQAAPTHAPKSVPTQAPTQAPPPVQIPTGGITCPRCGRVNKYGARFCAGCGTPLAPATSAPRLRCTSPRGTWELKIDRLPMRIGRRDPRQNHYPEVDLAEHDRGIASRNHAIINRDTGGFTVLDLGSTNGTFLNGNPVTPRTPQRLRSGDRIKIGEVEIEFLAS